MKLNLKQIQTVTEGAVSVEEQEDGFHFYRFTKEEMEVYKAYRTDFYEKTYATSGVRLNFVTDSKTLTMKFTLKNASSRRGFLIDIKKDGKLLTSFGNAKNDLPLTDPSFTLGTFEESADLGEGEKQITVYLPWSHATTVNAFSLDDGASIIPVQKTFNLLLYGDSITHGYDARHPSVSYASVLTDYLGAVGYNKAIGGEVFYPPLAKADAGITPDCITVAYGTNDWSHRPKDGLTAACIEFYKILAEKYPSATIFALAPIWRADMDKKVPFGDFRSLVDLLHTATAPYPNVKVIDCFDFVPKDPAYFSDLYLHPNDEGFGYYAKALCRAIEKHL